MTAGEAALPPLIVLHGANGSASDMQPLLDGLTGNRRVLAFDLLGHGGRAVPERLDLDALARDVVAQCDAAGVGAAHWFGYSVGGLVALRVATAHPERALSLATLTAKIVYDDAAVGHALHLTDAERLRRANPARAEALERMHAPQDWLRVIATVHRMFEAFAETAPMSRDEMARIATPLLALGALEDPMVPASEVRMLAATVRRGVPALFPGTAHPLAQAPLGTIVRTLETFMADPAKMIRSARVKLHAYRWDQR